MAKLHGRRILVTGGGSGIGGATARLFAQEGAAVAVADVVERAARAVADSFAGGHAVAMDVADAASVAAAVEKAATAMGGLDGVVNAAGVFSSAGLADTSPEAFTRMLAVNLTGTFLVVQAAAPLLRQAPAATVVNIGSGVGVLPTGPGSLAYVASKGGVIALTRALAMELAPAIRVNVVCPGAVDTPMTQGFMRDPSGAVDPAVASRYALRRAGQAEEIAAAILFLTTSDSSFVTGVTLPVDGGRTYH